MNVFRKIMDKIGVWTVTTRHASKIIWATGLFLMTLFILMIYLGLKEKYIFIDNKSTNVTVYINEMNDSLFNVIYDCVFCMRLDHPDIVMAQIIEESGHFQGKMFTEGNNLFGMKISGSRPTTAIGVIYGHAKYIDWEHSVIDYSLWQAAFARRLTRDEYFNLLDSIYAERKGYSDRLKKIIKSNGL